MRRIGKQFVLFLAVAFMMILSNRNFVSAAVCNVQKVDDIDNVVCPEMINLPGISNQSTIPVEFTMTESGIVMAYVQIGREYYDQGEVYLSTDYEGKYMIGESTIIKESTYLKYCLDPGKYYLQLRWDYQIYNVGVGVVYEASNTQEKYKVSKFAEANELKLDKLKKGFLSLTTPKDYYKFKLEKESVVDIQYSFDTTFANPADLGQMMIYDNNQVLIGNATYAKQDLGIKSEKIRLQPGTYFITLSGMKGRTTLKAEPTYYKTTLTPSTTKWSKKNVSVKIKTTIDFESIQVIKYDVTEADLNTESLWYPAANDKKYVETNGTTFVANENAVYSVRIMDKLGKYSLAKIKIKNIDKKLPKISGVQADKYYNKVVIVKWSDAESGIQKATLNGREIKSGYKITKNGEYELKVYDKVGNKKVIKFNIDCTKPVIHGIENGRTYTYVSVAVSDELSGLKKFTVNGVEYDMSKNPCTFAITGTYVIKAYDIAGNVSTKTFYIK